MVPKLESCRFLLISLLLVFGGGLLAWLVQTDLLRVEVRDIRFQDESGATLSALLYVPADVSVDNPAPGVLAVHGYVNSRETQSPYAIELSRRGYVVLNMDQRGHGYSDPPAFAAGFGGPAGLQFLRSLNIVDTDQIALIGHSMGGWAVLSAAARYPDQYTSTVVSGSSTGTFGVPPGDASFPRNFALVFGQYDEFSATMWGARSAAAIGSTDRLKAQFGTNGDVEPGRLYGSLSAGTARQLYQPAQTHPANHITNAGVAPVLDWVQATTDAPAPLDPYNQRWQLKELGTLLSLAGGVLFLFTFGRFLLATPVFRELRKEPAPAAGIRGQVWWLAAAIFVIIPALTFFPLQGLASAISANRLLGQNLTTGYMVWALGNTLISVILLLLWHFLLGGRASGNSFSSLGLSLQSDHPAKTTAITALFAMLVAATLYLVLWINHALFTADFRFWVVALKLMNRVQLHQFLFYLAPFTLFFVISGSLLNGQLRNSTTNVTSPAYLLRGGILMGLGIALLLLYQYGFLFTTGTLAIADQALLTIMAIQFAVLLPVTGILSAYFFRLTGSVYVGALINGLFITWLIVAGQATHYSF